MRTAVISLLMTAVFVIAVFARPALAQDPGSSPAATGTPAVSGSSSAPARNPFAITGAAAPDVKGPSVWGILPWGGIGVGARVMFPLGINPLLTHAAVHDRFALEVGGDLLHWSYNYGAPGFNNFNYSWTEVVPVAGVMWNVWFNEQFALYPKGELGYAFGWFSGWDGPGGRPTYGGVFFDFAGGALYKLASGPTLRAEIGYAGLKLGAGWLF